MMRKVLKLVADNVLYSIYFFIAGMIISYPVVEFLDAVFKLEVIIRALLCIGFGILFAYIIFFLVNKFAEKMMR